MQLLAYSYPNAESRQSMVMVLFAQQQMHFGALSAMPGIACRIPGIGLVMASRGFHNVIRQDHDGATSASFCIDAAYTILNHVRCTDNGWIKIHRVLRALFLMMAYNSKVPNALWRKADSSPNVFLRTE